MARLTLRRGLHVTDYGKPPQRASKPVPFSTLDRGEAFTLLPPEHINMLFIKTSDRTSRLHSMDDRVNEYQAILSDTPVYTVRQPTRKPE